MTYRGAVKHGAFELEGGATLPEGTTVETHPTAAAPCDEENGQALEKYARLARRTGLPPDFSSHHDRYIHGTSKQ